MTGSQGTEKLDETDTDEAEVDPKMRDLREHLVFWPGAFVFLAIFFIGGFTVWALAHILWSIFGTPPSMFGDLIGIPMGLLWLFGVGVVGMGCFGILAGRAVTRGIKKSIERDEDLYARAYNSMSLLRAFFWWYMAALVLGIIVLVAGLRLLF